MLLELLISFRQVGFTEWVDPFDVLSAMTNFRTLTGDTLDFLRTVHHVDDAFLHQLAQRGIWRHLGGMLDGQQITEAGILDYAFGIHTDDDRGRRLEVHTPQVTNGFLSNLIQVG